MSIWLLGTWTLRVLQPPHDNVKSDNHNNGLWFCRFGLKSFREDGIPSAHVAKQEIPKL